MAYAGKGVYEGVSWEAKPLGFREQLRCGNWVFPYFVGERIEFIFEVTSVKSIKLKDFPFFVRYTNPEYIAPLQEPSKLSSSKTFMEQHGATVSGERTIEYWIGDPSDVKSQLIFSAQGMFNDKLIIDILLGLFLAIVGFILGLKID